MLDMAGFAVNLDFYCNASLAHGGALLMPAKRGQEEEGFLRQLGLEVDQLEVVSPEEVLVWHTRTVQERPPTDPGTKYYGTNIETLWKQV